MFYQHQCIKYLISLLYLERGIWKVFYKLFAVKFVRNNKSLIFVHERFSRKLCYLYSAKYYEKFVNLFSFKFKNTLIYYVSRV